MLVGNREEEEINQQQCDFSLLTGLHVMWLVLFMSGRVQVVAPGVCLYTRPGPRSDSLRLSACFSSWFPPVTGSVCRSAEIWSDVCIPANKKQEQDQLSKYQNQVLLLQFKFNVNSDGWSDGWMMDYCTFYCLTDSVSWFSFELFISWIWNNVEVWNLQSGIGWNR